jgi:hypothetical protein
MRLFQILILVEAESITEEDVKNMGLYREECINLSSKLLNKPVEELNFVSAVIFEAKEEENVTEEEIPATPVID